MFLPPGDGLSCILFYPLADTPTPVLPLSRFVFALRLLVVVHGSFQLTRFLGLVSLLIIISPFRFLFDYRRVVRVGPPVPVRLWLSVPLLCLRYTPKRPQNVAYARWYAYGF